MNIWNRLPNHVVEVEWVNSFNDVYKSKLFLNDGLVLFYTSNKVSSSSSSFSSSSSSSSAGFDQSEVSK